jgi:hypothetical protein
MRLAVKLTVAVLVVLTVVAVLPLVASESGEVVVMTTRGVDGPHTTRLWVVEHDGHQWLRGSTDSGWYGRMLREPRVEVERAGTSNTYMATPVAQQVATINALMADKYGWGDRVVNLFAGDRSDAVAVRLDPAD